VRIKGSQGPGYDTPPGLAEQRTWPWPLRQSPLLRYGVATLAVAALLLLKLLLDPLIPQQSPFLLLAGAVVVGAWFGGFGPGVLATVLGALAGAYFTWATRGSFTVLGAGFVPLVLFVVQGLVISSLVEVLHSARRRAEESTMEAQSHQENMRQSERRFRQLFENSVDALFVHDEKGRIVDCNAEACRALGYSKLELAELSVADVVTHLVSEEERREKKGDTLWERAMRGEPGRIVGFEQNELVRKDGTSFPVEVGVGAIEYGGRRMIFASARDISERKRAEDALRESEVKYRTLVEQVPAITYIEAVDPEERKTDLTYVSPQITAMFGYSPEEWMGDPGLFERLLHPDDRERVLAEDARTDETEEPFSVEYRQFTRDGRVIWISDEASLVRDEEGRPLFWQGVMHDITDQKETEEALRQSEELYRSVVEQAEENIFLVDTETKRILQANAALHRLLGYSQNELEEITLYDIVAHDQESIDQNIQRIVQEGRRYVGERKYRRKDGTLAEMEVSASAVSYGGREVMCIVAHDVTERKRMENDLRHSLSVLLALREASQVLGSTLESEEIVSRLLEIMRGVSNLTAVVISVQDKEENIHIWRSTGLQGLWRRARFAPEAAAARQVVLEGGEQHLFRLRHPELESEHLVGLCLPLRSKDRIIGVLEGYGPESLAESDMVDILVSLASQATSALENAQLYEKLEEREQRLQELVGKLLRAQEEERRRVAYEVHDGLAQIAAGAHQHLQAFAERYTPGTEKGRRDLERILRLVRTTVSEARRIIADLRPTTLDDLGLAATIAQEVERLREDGYLVDYQEELGDERLPVAAEIALFRVAQEALTNVRKHAQTQQVRIELRRREDEVCLEVRDYGRGFDPTAAPGESGPGERVGLAGMRERISMLGGKLEIRSEPDVGTTVAVNVPLVQAA
jgi:PAS domain S-box-containing protein